MPLNFYELYNLLNENTVSQELKKIKQIFQQQDQHPSWGADFDVVSSKIKQDLIDAFFNVKISDKSITALSKWLTYIWAKNELSTNNKTVYVRTPPGNGWVDSFVNKFIEYLAFNLDQSGNFNQTIFSKLNDTKFDIQSLSQLSDQHKEDLKKKRGNVPGAPGKTLLSFPNGYKWVNLEKSYCEKEQEAGAHCGNKDFTEGDTILSLRDHRDFVFLTFVLNNGKLTEMKGKANSKPASKYHPYILELLKLPIIKQVGHGHSSPKDDFQITDLTKEQIQQLLKIKPQFYQDAIENRFRILTNTQANPINYASEIPEKVELSLDDLTDSDKVFPELVLLIKFFSKYSSHQSFPKSKEDIDEVFSEQELLELLNNPIVRNNERMSWHPTKIGNIKLVLAKKTRHNSVHRVILNHWLKRQSSRLSPNLLLAKALALNVNVSNDIKFILIDKSIEIAETLSKKSKDPEVLKYIYEYCLKNINKIGETDIAFNLIKNKYRPKSISKKNLGILFHDYH